MIWDFSPLSFLLTHPRDSLSTWCSGGGGDGGEGGGGAKWEEKGASRSGEDGRASPRWEEQVPKCLNSYTHTKHKKQIDRLCGEDEGELHSLN